MTELKTLKDFEAKLIEWKESEGFWINLEDLRAEAVKWVKMLEDWHKDLGAFGSWVKCPKCKEWFIMLNASFIERGYKLNCLKCKEKIEFQHEMIGPFTEFETMKPHFAIKQFKTFFNLTEEDLKCKKEL